MDSRSPSGVKPRRKPKRRTSHEIVEAILVAAREVIEERGYQRATTNQIAARAGVSIGSYYHYFPNKDSVMSQLAQRVEAQTLTRFQQVVQDSEGQAMEDRIAQVVDVLLSPEVLGSARLRHELTKHTPKSWTWQTAGEVDRIVAQNLAERFAEIPEIRKGRESLMAFVVLHSVEAVVEAAVLHRGELLEDPRLREELTHLATAYLRIAR